MSDRTTGRIETLADGVFAIAMTLLVLNVTVDSGLSHGDLLAAVRSVAPKALAYLVSFMVLAVYWVGHHNQYYWIKYTDRTFMWLNTFFLMSIAFIPFSTSLIANYPHEVFAILIYGANTMLAGVMLYLHWKYAAGPGKLVPEPIDPRLGIITTRRILLGIVFYAVATLLSFVSPIISVVLFALLPFLYMRSSEIDRFLKSQHGGGD